MQSATAKQRSKRKQTYLVCLQVVKKYKKVESINTQSDYETTSKKCADKKKKNFSVCFLKMIKLQENKFKIIQKNF